MKLRVPADQKLRPFQEKGVRRIIKRFTKKNAEFGNVCVRGAYLGDHMGLGKTPQAIVTCNTLNLKKVLIVCPAVAIPVWEDMLKQWSLLPRRLVVSINKPGDAALSNLSNFTLVSFNRVISTPVLDILKVNTYDLLIIDEAHYLKNYKSKRTRAVLGFLWRQAKYRLALSGTPCKKNITDLYTLAHKFAPHVFDDYFKFANRYAFRENNGFADVYYGVRNAEELSRIIRSLFLVRRTKQQVLKELPPKEYTKVTLPKKYAVIDMPDTPEELVRREAEALVRAIENDEDIPVVANLAQLRKLQGIKKIPAIVEFIKEFVEQGIPLVVFAWHTAVLEGLVENFKDENPAVIVGKTSQKMRRHHVARFQKGDTSLFIGQMQAAGVAITLTRATHCLLAEMDWSPDTVNQAVDRLHRIGQTGNVMIYYTCVKDSVDEIVADTVVRKTREFKKVFDRGIK